MYVLCNVELFYLHDCFNNFVKLFYVNNHLVSLKEFSNQWDLFLRISFVQEVLFVCLVHSSKGIN